MKIGVNMTISSESIDITDLAKKAEALGFESLWLPEHPVIPVHTTSRYQGSADGSIPASSSPRKTWSNRTVRHSTAGQLAQL